MNPVSTKTCLLPIAIQRLEEAGLKPKKKHLQRLDHLPLHKFAHLNIAYFSPSNEKHPSADSGIPQNDLGTSLRKGMSRAPP